MTFDGCHLFSPKCWGRGYRSKLFCTFTLFVITLLKCNTFIWVIRVGGGEAHTPLEGKMVSLEWKSKYTPQGECALKSESMIFRENVGKYASYQRVKKC